MGGRGGIAGNPVLIGAATVLVVLVAVFLAYNANQGLPFVPTYSLKAETPSAANLVRGNEVRIGGTRVGTVTGCKKNLRLSPSDGAIGISVSDITMIATLNIAGDSAGMKKYPSRAAKKVRYHRLFVLILR